MELGAIARLEYGSLVSFGPPGVRRARACCCWRGPHFRRVRRSSAAEHGAPAPANTPRRSPRLTDCAYAAAVQGPYTFVFEHDSCIPFAVLHAPAAAPLSRAPALAARGDALPAPAHARAEQEAQQARPQKRGRRTARAHSARDARAVLPRLGTAPGGAAVLRCVTSAGAGEVHCLEPLLLHRMRCGRKGAPAALPDAWVAWVTFGGAGDASEPDYVLGPCEGGVLSAIHAVLVLRVDGELAMYNNSTCGLWVRGAPRRAARSARRAVAQLRAPGDPR